MPTRQNRKNNSIIKYFNISIIIAIFAMCGVHSFAESAEKIITIIEEQLHIKKGLCILPNCQDISLPCDLAEKTSLTIVALSADNKMLNMGRERALKTGILGKKIYFIENKNIEKIPFADNYADVIILNSNDLCKESLRVLQPKGIYILNDKVVTKEKPTNIDDWQYWNHSADNNLMSKDDVAKPPFFTQWHNEPYGFAWANVTLVADGRTFVVCGSAAMNWCMDTRNKIFAYNGYNGTILWTHSVKPADDKEQQSIYLGSLFFATSKIFYYAKNNKCIMLDSKTGAKIGELSFTPITNPITYMTIDNNILYLMDNDKETPTICAYDLKTNKILWELKETGGIHEKYIAIRDNKMIYNVNKKYIRCLNATTGKEVWKNEENEYHQVFDATKVEIFPFRKKTPGIVLSPEVFFMLSIENGNKDVWFFSMDTGKQLIRGKRNRKVKITRSYENILAIYDHRDNGIFFSGDRSRRPAIVKLRADGSVMSDRFPQDVGSYCIRYLGTAFGLIGRNNKHLNEFRSSCDDGIIPGNGMMYCASAGYCSCNYKFFDMSALCSAKDKMPSSIMGKPMLITGNLDLSNTEKSISDDWLSYRGNIQNSASTNVAINNKPNKIWSKNLEIKTTPAIAVNDNLYLGCKDGRICKLNINAGNTVWTYYTGGEIKYSPTFYKGCIFAGSADGWLYCINANTGSLVWKFCVANNKRYINVYDSINSTWGFNSGVIVENDIVYAGAGMNGRDGIAVCALQSNNGEILWINRFEELQKRNRERMVSLLGNMTIGKDILVLSSGASDLSPLQLDKTTGELLNEIPEIPFVQVLYTRGKEVLMFKNNWVLCGGGRVNSSTYHVGHRSPGIFIGSAYDFLHLNKNKDKKYVKIRGAFITPPAWDNDIFVHPISRDGKIYAWDTKVIETELNKIADGTTEYGEMPLLAQKHKHYELLQGGLDVAKWGPIDVERARSIVLSKNNVIIAVDSKYWTDGNDIFKLQIHSKKDGKLIFETKLSERPLSNGICISQTGIIIITLESGKIITFK